MTWLDWFCWSLVGVLAAGGLALAGWSLLADRSRGRHRCPRCWYNMSGSPGLRCSECGRESRSEKKLFRTRRRWRWALVGVLLMFGSLAAYLGREVQKHGWVAATPTVAYIALLPRLDATTTFSELQNRLNAGTLLQCEYRLLVHRCIGVLRDRDSDAALLTRVATMLASIDSAWRNIRPSQPWKSWATVSDIDHDRCIETLVDLLAHEDTGVQSAALIALAGFREKAVSAIPAVMGQLGNPKPMVRQQAEMAIECLSGLFGTDVDGFPMDPLEPPKAFWDSHESPDVGEFYRIVGACGADVARARTVFLAACRSGTSRVRCGAIFGLAMLDADDPEAQRQILQMANDRDGSVRRAVLAATSMLPMTPDVEGVLRDVLAYSDMNARRIALRCIGLHGAAGKPLLDPVRVVLQEDGQPENPTAEAAWAFVRIGGDPEVAVDAVLEKCAIIPPSGPKQYFPGDIDKLGRFGIPSPRACKALEPMLADSGVECSAALAYARLGGQNIDLATQAIFSPGCAPPFPGMVNSRARAFARNGRYSREFFDSVLSSAAAVDRASAVTFLGEAGRAAEPMLPQMRSLLADPDPNVRAWAEQAVKRVEYLIEHPEVKFDD